MAVARAWTLDDEAVRRSPASVGKPRSFWRSVVLPCAKISVGGLLAVGYLLLSARVSALEIQRADLQKRIDAELVRKGALQREYQRVTGADAVKGYTANLGLQDKPQAVQSISVRDAVPRSQTVAARFDQGLDPATGPNTGTTSTCKTFAQIAP